MLLLKTRLSISFQTVCVSGLRICIWCCWCCCRRLFVVVTVDCILTFVGDRHGVFQSYSSLLCRDRVCARVEPLAHTMWVFTGVIFHCFRSASVTVSFSEDRINSRSFNFVVAAFYIFLFCSCCVFRIVGYCETCRLKFSDHSLQLRNGSTNVWKLDNVCFWCFCQFPQFK